MKLLWCKKCGDMFNLTFEVKTCSCGEAKGKYINDPEAVYSGEAIPLAIDNYSLNARARNFEKPNYPFEDFYDKLYKEHHIQSWVLRKGSPNWKTVKKVKDVYNYKRKDRNSAQNPDGSVGTESSS